MSRTLIDDVLRCAIRENRLVSEQGVLATPVRAHWPWARSLHGRARLVHLVQCAAIVWWRGEPLRLGAKWQCHGERDWSPSAELLASADGAERCPTCYEPQAGSLVYYAERNNLIKIGRSGQVGIRVSNLAARLLATEPGGPAVERQRHIDFAAARVAGEWFHPSPELLLHIRSLTEQVA